MTGVDRVLERANAAGRQPSPRQATVLAAQTEDAYDHLPRLLDRCQDCGKPLFLEAVHEAIYVRHATKAEIRDGLV